MPEEKPDFVNIRETDGGALHSVRWSNVVDIEDHTDDKEPFVILRMASGEIYTVKEVESFHTIRDRRKDAH